MDNLLILLACLILGFLFKRIPSFPNQVHVGLNAYIIWIALPALALVYIPHIEFSIHLLWLALVAWIVFGISIPFFRVFSRIFNWDKKTTGCLVLACGLCNTSFVGFPLLEFLYGSEEPLKYAIITDQAGSFLVVATVGIIVAMQYAGNSPTRAFLLKKLFTFPPFIAFLLALLLIKLGGVPVILESVLKRLASPLVMLALFSVGLQIEFSRKELAFLPISFGLLYKLFLAPLIIFLFYQAVFQHQNMAFEVGILEAAMPPMVTGVILTQEYDLKPKLGSILLAIGIPLSLLTVWLWFWWIR